MNNNMNTYMEFLCLTFLVRAGWLSVWPWRDFSAALRFPRSWLLLFFCAVAAAKRVQFVHK